MEGKPATLTFENIGQPVHVTHALIEYLNEAAY